MFRLLSGVYLGWGLGANDAANVFGTAVATRVLTYRTAVILTSIFVLIGSLAQGSRGMHTVGALADMDVNTAFIASLAAAITINILTLLAIPVSTSQAIVGAILAVGLLGSSVELRVLFKVLVSWVASPVAAAGISFLLYRVLGSLIEARVKSVRIWSMIMKTGFYLAGMYGAYALGANNVANTTAVFVEAGMVGPTQAALIGGIAIGLGVLTYSQRVMYTVGKRITRMSEFAGLVAILGQDLTVHFFSWVGVPVSTSQAIVGAVMGVGLVKSSRAVDFGVIGRILIGWFATPVAAFAIAWILLQIHGMLFLG
jgi:PiT family inorganic phosphate transporter